MIMTMIDRVIELSEMRKDYLFAGMTERAERYKKILDITVEDETVRLYNLRNDYILRGNSTLAEYIKGEIRELRDTVSAHDVDRMTFASEEIAKYVQSVLKTETGTESTIIPLGDGWWVVEPEPGPDET